MPDDKTLQSMFYNQSGKEPLKMSDLDILISFRNKRSEILCKAKCIEPELKILFFTTEQACYHSTIETENVGNPEFNY